MKQTILGLAVLLFSFGAYAQQHKPKSGKKPPVRKHAPLPPIKRTVPPPPVVEPAPTAYEPSTPPDAASRVYTSNDGLENMPEFTGGMPALRQYFVNNLQYPADALEQDIEGKVIVSFTVCEDGRLCDEKIIRSVGGGCDAEALRVIKKMPQWRPGTRNGKPVKVKYVLPVMFQLQD